MTLASLDDYFGDWKEREALAEAMIPLVGEMYRRNVVCYIYGRTLAGRSVINIMKTHRFVRQSAQNELSEFESYPIIKALSTLDVGPAHIDVGKLTVTYMELQAQGSELSVEDFLQQQVGHLIHAEGKPLCTPQDVVIYGFGRIGRLLARLLVEKTGGGTQLRLRAVVVRPSQKNDLVKRASLLRRDSVHGSFEGTIRVLEDENCIVANGNVVRFIYAAQPEDVDYTAYGIEDAMVIDSTGVFRDEEALGRHLKSKGASKVLLTAPAKGNIKNLVQGVNSDQLTADDKIVSAASCTTNAIVPVLKAINDKYGVAHGHMETVHAYTNDQNLIDNYHSKDRRGRSAAMNLVLTETGAAKAVAKALPELLGKLTGNAIRVPIPNVSMAILNLTLDVEITRAEVNEFLRDTALNSRYQRQIDFVNSPEVVSSDFVGSRHACVVDAKATIVNNKNLVLYVWYDNEFGYSCQVVRLVQEMCGVQYPQVPDEIHG